MDATSVEISMLPENAQPFYAANSKGWDTGLLLSSPKSTPVFRRRRDDRRNAPSIREIVTGVALVACIVALGLLYVKVLTIDQRLSCSTEVNPPQTRPVATADHIATDPVADVVTDAVFLSANRNQNTVSTISPLSGLARFVMLYIYFCISANIRLPPRRIETKYITVFVNIMVLIL